MQLLFKLKSHVFNWWNYINVMFLFDFYYKLLEDDFHFKTTLPFCQKTSLNPCKFAGHAVSVTTIVY